jgi:hypothetical protein
MKPAQSAHPYSFFYSCLFFLFFLGQSICSPIVQAETLVPLHIQDGTNLIHIARKYCSKQSDWPIIAKVNNLKSPYTIRAKSTLQIPLSILRTKDVAAQVASLSGTPRLVTKDSQILELHKGDSVLPGQTVVTDKNEYVHLVYPDHKHTRIGPQSEMTLTYLMRLTDDSLKAEFSLKKGRLVHSVNKKLGANEDFDTRTAIAITGIRGTEFRIKAEDSETNIVETLRGKVILEAAGKNIVLRKGKGSKVKKGEAPSPAHNLPAQPDLPIIQEVYRTLPVVITAPAHKTAKSMRLRVTADSEGQTTLLEEIAEPGQDFILFSLTDGHYYAFLTAVDEKDFESLPSTPFPLYVRTIPAAPLISKPNSGLQTFDPKITIQWLKSELAKSYFLQLATDQDFTEIVDTQQVQENSFTIEDLTPGVYFFRVQLIAEDGFETLFSPPLTWEVVEQPKLGSMGPLEQGEDGIVLKWPAIAKMSGYVIQVATDKNFNHLLVSDDTLTEPSYTIVENLAPGDHYVRISAIMENGQHSPWTQTQILTIDGTSPGIGHVLLILGFIAVILL